MEDEKTNDNPQSSANPNSDELVPVFMPALIVLLVHAEDEKGTPLTKDEVHGIRDNAACVMMDVDAARKLEESREYRDIDPENCWHDWQMARREMGREPDLDPGPRFDHVQASDPGYQQTIRDARDSIERFRAMLPSDGTARLDALIKTKLVDGESSAFMWLSNTAIEGEHFSAELFEVPDSFSSHSVGDRHLVAVEDLMDWMINDNGRLSGGFSLRYHRATLPDDEKEAFDQHLGVTEYAS